MTRGGMANGVAGVLLLGLCLACGSSDAPDASREADAGPRVVLGSGREAFEPLESGGDVPLIKGIQGGYHVWASFLAYGFDNDVLRMELSTRWGERDESVLDMSGSVGVKPASDASGVPALVMLGWPALVYEPGCSNGEAIEIDLTVRDASGRSAGDSRRWILNVAEEDRSASCPP